MLEFIIYELQHATFWVGFGSIVFLAFVWWQAGDSIKGMLDKRGVEISAKIDEASDLLSQAEAQMEEYRAKFGKADADAAAIVEQATDEAKRLTEKAGTDLSSLLERRSAAFDQRMNQLQVQAQNDLKSRAAELAIGALRKSLPEQLDAAALASLADTAIDDLPNRV
jgi:F-type H+-transporting ATPase subunit b